jgi:hypothetical protein
MKQSPWLLVFLIGLGLLGLVLVGFGTWILVGSNSSGQTPPASALSNRSGSLPAGGMIIITATLDLSQDVLADPSSAPKPPEADNAGPTAPTPPISTPTPIIPWKACQDSYPSNIRPFDHATVSLKPPLPNNVRVEPDAASKFLFAIQPGDEVDVIGGPGCSGGWVWWQIKTASGKTGWTAEGDGKDYWLVPVK